MTKPWDVAASEQRKAILGGAVALLTALLSALQDGLAPNEIAAVVVAAIGYLTVFTTENRPAPKRRKVAGETGHSAIELAIGAVVLIILVVLLLKLV